MSQSIWEVYKEHLKASQKTREGQQKTTPPQPKPNQSIKFIVERGLEVMNNLAHAQRLQRQENLSP